jgi:hypothetical protein
MPVSVLTASGSEVVLVGVIAYTVVVTNDVKIARVLCLFYLSFFFLTKYRILLGVRNLTQCIESVLGFFVVKAKDHVKLDDHMPQILTRHYEAATTLGVVPFFIFRFYRS